MRCSGAPIYEAVQKWLPVCYKQQGFQNMMLQLIKNTAQYSNVTGVQPRKVPFCTTQRFTLKLQQSSQGQQNVFIFWKRRIFCA
jgi:hypothetical protein